MIHPFMPFLSEELWQRLPRRPSDTTPSIVRAAYPEESADFEDPKSAIDYELILESSKGIRSLTAEYGIKDNGKGILHHHHRRFFCVLTFS
jgi:valyl-tRNA synthetase